MNTYLRVFCLAVPGLFLLGAVINYALDPLGYFRNHGWHDGTFAGNRVWADDRMVFDLSIDAYNPDTLIVGNSRVARGFALDDEQLPERLGATLKLGVRGAQFDELDRYTRRVLTGNSVRHLVIGLDLGQFLQGRDRYVRAEQQRQLESGKTFPGVPNRQIAALWSKTAFLASANVVLGVHKSRLDGGANPEVMHERLHGVGHRALTREVEARALRDYPRFDPGVYTARLTALDRLLADACRKDIAVRLFVSPLHIRQLLLIRETGHFPVFSDWKRELTARVGRHHAAGCRATLTDFSGISRYTSERFPPPGNRQDRMRWYWESSHYHHTLGQMIINRLWESGANHDDFGKRLTPGNISDWLDASASELDALVRDRPLLVKEIRSLRP